MVDISGVVIPGHPLYAQIKAESIITKLLEKSLHPEIAKVCARSIIIELVTNDPGIYFATEEELING